MSKLLITGGAGYIGSHAVVALMEQGHDIVIYDDLSNSSESVVGQITKISNRECPLVIADIRDTSRLVDSIKKERIEAVFHFAGHKAVGESVEKPIDYYANNVQGTISLLQAMQQTGVKTLVFSSSATVYGEPQYLPLDESHPTSATNPYGRSKLHIEEILYDVSVAFPDWRIACLRYFNPAGAHASGLIGENPVGIPNNLMPFVAQVANGQRSELSVFGDDYDTPDGTGVRDYIHVMDLVEGHIAALGFLQSTTGWHAFNLGTGRGYSVLEVVRAFDAVSGRAVPYSVTSRRPGDIASCYADTTRAREMLKWSTKRSLQEMCASAWAFQTWIKTGVVN